MGVKRVPRYLKGTLNYGLKFSVHGEETHLYGYSDANWSGDAQHWAMYFSLHNYGTIS